MAAIGESPSVLIVDDEPPVREMLVSFFNAKGYGAATAAGGKEALRLIGRAPPRLVVLDLLMPGMDGLAALRRIKKLDGRIPVIMLTAHGTVETAVAAMRLGADDYVTKPFRAAELWRAVQNALSRQEPFAGPPRALCGPQAETGLQSLMGHSPQVAKVLRAVEQVAPTDMTVLVYGETGAGKSLVADAIHNASPRAEKRFVRVDCGAIPDTLIESELFGHERGAFTGADERHEGFFELAHGGTLFLDEIANLSKAMMRKLLCALDDGRVYRVGGTQPVGVDVRVVAASNQDLEQLVQEGKFRRDLFYRLNEFTIEVPALRERTEDIPFLARRFVERANAELGRDVQSPSPELIKRLVASPWPGNARELRNVLRRAVLLSDEAINPEHIPPNSLRSRGRTAGDFLEPFVDRALSGKGSFKEVMRDYDHQLEARIIRAALERTGGNRSKAARMLGVDYKTLYYKAKELGV